jgi:hypothetical protein
MCAVCYPARARQEHAAPNAWLTTIQETLPRSEVADLVPAARSSTVHMYIQLYICMMDAEPVAERLNPSLLTNSQEAAALGAHIARVTAAPLRRCPRCACQ